MKRPRAIALDMVETVFALEPVARELEAAGMPKGSLRLFFSQLLRDAFAIETSGAFAPFKEIAAGSLAVLMAGHDIESVEARTESVLAGFSRLDPHPDVRPALERLRDAGVPVIALTNGGAENTRNLIERAGLSALLERTISIDEVGRWKPNPEVYLRAARTARIDPWRMALVAAHAWDVNGAKQAGLCGAWVRRQDRRYHAAMRAPDVHGDSLPEVVEKLLALPD